MRNGKPSPIWIEQKVWGVEWSGVGRKDERYTTSTAEKGSIEGIQRLIWCFDGLDCCGGVIKP